MRMLRVLAIISAVLLLQACAGNGDDSEPSPASTTPTLHMDSDEIVAFVQEYQVVKRVEEDDGSWHLILVPLASRVEEYCSDSPRWSTSEGPIRWQVFAECTKEQSVPVDGPLRFEWLFHPDAQSVWPLNRAAHVAQYQYPWEQEPISESPWYQYFRW
jgi:hypothetical protein